jgi:hypothetical protein
MHPSLKTFESDEISRKKRSKTQQKKLAITERILLPDIKDDFMCNNKKVNINSKIN